MEQEAVNRMQARLASLLGDPSFGEAVAAGRAMPIDQAIRLASDRGDHSITETTYLI